MTSRRSKHLSRNQWHEKVYGKVEDGISCINLNVEDVDIEEMADNASDLKKLTVSELKDILRDKGLFVSGTKDALIERIRNSVP